MVVTEDVTLPEKDELKVKEVKVSAATLMTAGPYIGKQCEVINNEFMLCREEHGDPRPCLALGKQVTACTMEVLRRMKKHCLEEFKQYANCVDKSSGDYSFRHCRKTQAVFDFCMEDRLCVRRPEFGYFTRGRVHTSNTKPPPPPPCPCHPKVEDATPSLPDCKPIKKARFGGRIYWSLE